MERVAKRRYDHHRQNARKRGIEFLFTYKQWAAWWENKLGPNWLEKRGRTVGKYCMARFKDKGPYAPGNVKCILHSENNAEMKFNGTLRGCFQKGHAGWPHKNRNGRKKRRGGSPHTNGIKITPQQAVDIYRKQATQRELAVTYKVSERLVRLIKSKQVWKATLADL